MRNSKGPTVYQLQEFNHRAWKELRAYSPENRRAGGLLELGLVMIGISVTSLILYGIYRALGATVALPSGPVSTTVWLVAALGIGLGCLLAVASVVIRRQAPGIPQFTEADIDVARRADDRLDNPAGPGHRLTPESRSPHPRISQPSLRREPAQPAPLKAQPWQISSRGWEPRTG